jgi:S-adenosylmethionine:tRNA ribosyltransferase-isomerase
MARAPTTTSRAWPCRSISPADGAAEAEGPPAPAVPTSDFDFDLPPERIASRPARPRDASRLLRLGRIDGAVSHHAFAGLPGLLAPGDLVVLNDTRVLPARIGAVKPRTGGRVELLLLEAAAPGRWRTMVKGKLREGEAVVLEGGLEATVEAAPAEGFATLRLDPKADVPAHLERHGRVPLPPYIKRPADAWDRDDYQTVFAHAPGSVAAPTSGLHFTPAVFEGLKARGVAWTHVTLHVGAGTFLPVRTGDAAAHTVLPERYVVPEAAAAAIRAARARGGRVIACGTTVTRALEAAAREDGTVAAGAGSATLFIRPGHAFRVPDGLLTNFHLPRSSLLLLVCAFAGRERVLAAYAEALREGYRFYSYGDAMLIV